MTLESILKQLSDEIKNTTPEQLQTYANQLLEDAMKLQPVKMNSKGLMLPEDECNRPIDLYLKEVFGDEWYKYI
ncbi:MAG: hypothetical protein ABFD07_14085 [Methanobacterium sp.]